MSENLYVQLIWEEPITGELNQPLLMPPIAIGREVKEMPRNLGSYTVSHVELIHKQVSRFHALITVADQQMFITDKSSNGTYINGRLISKGSQQLSSKDTLRIGPYKITAILITEKQINSTDINRELSHSFTSTNTLGKNTVLLWFFGGILIIVLTAGVWFSVKSILDKLRPSLPNLPVPNSSTIEDKNNIKI